MRLGREEQTKAVLFLAWRACEPAKIKTTPALYHAWENVFCVCVCIQPKYFMARCRADSAPESIRHACCCRMSF